MYVLISYGCNRTNIIVIATNNDTFVNLHAAVYRGYSTEDDYISIKSFC